MINFLRHSKEYTQTISDDKLDMCPCPLVVSHRETISGCINFNNYFPDAQSDLLYILTTSPTPGHDPGAALGEI